MRIYSHIAQPREAFKQVVVEGVRLPMGMPRFTDFTDKEIDGLMHYLRAMARSAVLGQAAKMSHLLIAQAPASVGAWGPRMTWRGKPLSWVPRWAVCE